MADPTSVIGTGEVLEELVFFALVFELQMPVLSRAVRDGRKPNAVANHLDNTCVCRGIDRDCTNAFPFDGAAKSGAS